MIGEEAIFLCYDCNLTFDEPKIWTNKHGLDTPPYEEYAGCPFCGGSFALTYRCNSCGEWIVGEYVKTDSGQRFCENCYNTYEIGDED